jgi:hypothetical protein
MLGASAGFDSLCLCLGLGLGLSLTHKGGCGRCCHETTFARVIILIFTLPAQARVLAAGHGLQASILGTTHSLLKLQGML